MGENKLQLFLSSNGINPEEESLAQYGVKGMKWGKNKSIEELQKDQAALDDALGGVDSGLDLDDLELESAGSVLDAALAGKKKPPTAADRFFGNDKDDKFWESSGRNAENFLSGLWGKNAQAARNKKVINIAAESTKGAADFVKGIFGGGKKK